jgi:phospholipid/cholesterol/gamma-HCH transport system substrate-binding protein
LKHKPLVNDLRVFADSLARDPGQLGVRGALQRRPAGSGFKGTLTGQNENSW